MSVLTLGLVCNTTVQQRGLAHAIEECGFKVGARLVPGQFLHGAEGGLKWHEQSAIDAWVVDVDADASNPEFDQWLELLDTPVILGDGEPPAIGSPDYSIWFERLSKQFIQMAGAISLDRGSDSVAENVCVIAASTGGPAAVKLFFDCLPAGLKTGFIYVQHIDVNHDDVLVKMMSQHSHYPAYIAAHGQTIRQGQVAVLSPAEGVSVLDNGTFCHLPDASWPGPFAPSIDCVVANVSQVFGVRAGAIIFTGMGEDGLVACRLMEQRGGFVWAQSLDSCVVESMPAAIMKADLASFSGTPEGLAKQFERQYGHG